MAGTSPAMTPHSLCESLHFWSGPQDVEMKVGVASSGYPRSAVSTSFTQYEVPTGITSSLKL